MKDYAIGVLNVSGLLVVPGILTLAVLWLVSRLSRQAVPEVRMKEPEPLSLPKKKMTASSILLLIGTAFIVFASIAFVAANWNNMEPAGKVFTLLGVSVAAFAISGVLNAAIKLTKTSIAFYAMGMLITAVAFVTAGYYELFGSWLSIGGDGEMLLYGAAAIIVAAASFVGYAFYKNAAMHYIGFSFAALAITMICGQLSDKFAVFSVIIIAVQLVMTAVTEILDCGSKKIWGKPMKIVARAASCVYGAIALSYVLWSFFEAEVYTFIVLAAVLVQLFFYGFFKKSMVLRIAADVFAFYAALAVSVHVDTVYDTSSGKIVFAGLTLLVYAANRFISKFGIIERITALTAASLGAFVSMTASDPLILKIAAPLLVSAAIAEIAFNGNIIIQYIAGILSPFMPYFVTITISDTINMEYHTVKALTCCGYAVVCMAAAAAVRFE